MAQIYDMWPDPNPASNSGERLIFNCASCGLKLTVERHLAGISGPCPACGVQINAPASPSKAVSRHRKGRIAGDLILDHQHLDQRETAKTSWIMMLFILAFCACLAVYWFLKDWGSR